MNKLQEIILKIDEDEEATFPLTKFIWVRFAGLICFIPTAALIIYYLFSE